MPKYLGTTGYFPIEEVPTLDDFHAKLEQTGALAIELSAGTDDEAVEILYDQTMKFRPLPCFCLLVQLDPPEHAVACFVNRNISDVDDEYVAELRSEGIRVELFPRQ